MGAPRTPAAHLVPFVAAGVALLVAAAATAALRVSGVLAAGSPVPLHLALAGGASVLVVGAAQFFATAAFATGPPSRRTTGAQLACWAVALVATVAALQERSSLAAGVAAAAGLATLVLLAASLRAMRRRSLQRPRWILRWYLSAAAFLAAGGVLGAALLIATWAPPGDLRAAHVELVLLGWLGTAIVGTVHTLLPSLVRAPAGLPRFEAPTFACWVAGVPLLAAGLLADAWVLGWAGRLLLHAAAVLLLANAIRTVRGASAPVPIAGRLVVLGQASLVGATTIAGLVPPVDASAADLHGLESPLAATLVAGWVGMTVLGSLYHLTGVLGLALGRRPVAPGTAAAHPTAVAALASAALVLLALATLLDLAPLAAVAGAGLLVVAMLVGIPVLRRVAAMTVPAHGLRPPRSRRYKSAA